MWGLLRRLNGVRSVEYDKDDLDSRKVANEVNDEMIKRFEEVCGSCNCCDLLGCDISTPEGAACAREN